MLLLEYYRSVELLLISDDVLMGTAKYKGLCIAYTVYKNAIISVSYFK